MSNISSSQSATVAELFVNHVAQDEQHNILLGLAQLPDVQAELAKKFSPENLPSVNHVLGLNAQFAFIQTQLATVQRSSSDGDSNSTSRIVGLDLIMQNLFADLKNKLDLLSKKHAEDLANLHDELSKKHAEDLANLHDELSKKHAEDIKKISDGQSMLATRISDNRLIHKRQFVAKLVLKRRRYSQGMSLPLVVLDGVLSAASEYPASSGVVCRVRVIGRLAQGFAICEEI